MKVKQFGAGPHRRRICLINPKNPRNLWTMQGTAEMLGGKTLLPSSALSTLVALTPPHLNVEYIQFDENVQKLDFNVSCDLIVLTGFTLHLPRMKEIVAEFKKRKIPIAIGGPYASLSTEECERLGLADHLFAGEGEYIWPQFLNDWFEGTTKSKYVQSEPINFADSPAPDWSTVNPNHYLHFTVQTTRGCPHKCDYCDVIRVHGRKIRNKPIDHVMAELQTAHDLGVDHIFVSDDNFISKKSYSRELLKRIIEWNTSLKRPLKFITQTTVNLADSEDILRLMADARFVQVFLGVESVRHESLKEVNKKHNIRTDLVEKVRLISSYGISPIVGMMVGFDSDDNEIFDEQEAFVTQSYSPLMGLSMLNAPHGTPLYHRLKAEGRLVADNFSGEWQLETNIIPNKLTRQELYDGYKKLFVQCYDIDRFEERLSNWLENIKYVTPLYTKKKNFKFKNVSYFINIFPRMFTRYDSRMRNLFYRSIRKTFQVNPKLLSKTILNLLEFIHFYKFIKTQFRDDLDIVPQSNAVSNPIERDEQHKAVKAG